MRAGFRIHELADRDIVEIAEYVSGTDPTVGLRFIAAVGEQIKRVSAFPGMGKLRSDVPKRLKGVRSISIRGLKIICCFTCSAGAAGSRSCVFCTVLAIFARSSGKAFSTSSPVAVQC